MVEHRHQRLGKRQQGHRAGHGQQDHQTQTPVQQLAVARAIVRRTRGRQLGQQHHAQRHAQHGRGELHQAIGVGEPADAAAHQVGGDLCVDQQRDLGHAHPQQGWQHQRGDAACTGMAPGGLERRPAQTDARQHADSQQRGDLHAQLQCAAQHHAGGHGVDGLDAVGLEPGRTPVSRRNHAQVEQHRRGRRHRKMLPGVEDAGRQGDHGHEADVGEHPARHEHRGLEALRILLQAAGHGPDQHRRTRHTDHAGHGQGPGQHRSDLVHQGARRVVPVGGTHARQHRHERLAEGPLGKQAAQEVGNAKRHIEGVGQGAGAKGRGHEQLPHQPRDPGSQGQEGDERGGFEQRHPRSVPKAGAKTRTQSPRMLESSALLASSPNI